MTKADTRPSLPSDPHAAREFLQSRVRVYLRIVLAIWGAAFLADRALSVAQHGDVLRSPTPWYLVAHLLGLGALIACL